MTTTPCPRCAQALSVQERGDIALGPCFGCGGLWLSAAAAATIEAALSRDADEAAALLEARVASPFVDDRGGGAPLPCPLCHEAMQRWPVGDVVVDHCPTHGTWYDHGELERVQDHLSRQLSAQDTFVIPGQFDADAPDDGALELAREPTRGKKRTPSVNRYDATMGLVWEGMMAAAERRRHHLEYSRRYGSRSELSAVSMAESWIYGDDWWT